jgi:hypothetical protein
MGILGHVSDYEKARAIVAEVMDAVPAGSYLMLWDGTQTIEEAAQAAQNYAQSGAVPYNLRSPEQVGRYFAGLGMVEPGLVSISQWRPVGCRDQTNRCLRRGGPQVIARWPARTS